MKYRVLRADDRIQKGDEYDSLEFRQWTAIYTDKYIGKSPEHLGDWRRLIKEHNWISFKDRKPTKEDTDKQGRVAVLYRDYGEVINLLRYFTDTAASHWMPLNFIEDEPPRIKVRNEDVVPNKDGSLTISCTTISKQDMDEIIRQREEAMK